jgi:hypothetical protein
MQKPLQTGWRGGNPSGCGRRVTPARWGTARMSLLVINNRLLLVDPGTGIVVADVTQ